MESSIQIEERAAEWLAKRDSANWSASDEAALDAWLEQSTLHVVAFVRLEAAWNQALRLKALSASVPPGTVPLPEEWQLTPFFDRDTTPALEPGSDSSPSHPVGPSLTSSVESGSRIVVTIPEGAQRLRGDSPNNFETFGVGTANQTERDGAAASGRRRRYFALAASVLLATTLSLGWYFWPFGPTYSTPVGGIAAVPMSDGSKVTLNTNSEIRVAVTDSERRVQLKHGEAYFEVAKDPNRPFVVIAGKTRVVALGTKFSVRREGNDVRVFVTEGKVRFEDASSPEREGEGTGVVPADFHSGKILLTAGSVACATDESVLVQTKALPVVEEYLSWRTGYLIFRDMSLSDAIAEFNRYNTRKIVIEDPAVAAIRISGKFRSTQFEAFVRLLEEGFPIHAQSENGRIILTDARNDRAQGTAASP